VTNNAIFFVAICFDLIFSQAADRTCCHLTRSGGEYRWLSEHFRGKVGRDVGVFACFCRI